MKDRLYTVNIYPASEERPHGIRPGNFFQQVSGKDGKLEFDSKVIVYSLISLCSTKSSFSVFDQDSQRKGGGILSSIIFPHGHITWNLAFIMGKTT